MKSLLLVGLLLYSFSLLHSQTIEEIKAYHNTFLWGEGSGTTLNKADQAALGMLISQISTQVESSFTLLKEELTTDDESREYAETYKSVIKTYSKATVKNTERIVISNEPDARVFRYIRRADVEKLFEDRKDKILGFAENAETAITNSQVADGLRYYYWALTLLISHPEGSHIKYMDTKGNLHQLATWLPLQINNIFASLSFDVAGVEKRTGFDGITLNIRYKGRPVENFDYSYWTGSDWSNLISARNGIGLIELYGAASDVVKVKIKAEYIFEGEACVDRELEEVLSTIDPIPFRNSYFTIPLTKSHEVKPITIKSDVAEAPLTDVAEKYQYQKSMGKIINGIKTRDYAAIQTEFTDEGYDVFTRLVNYGNAKVIGKPEFRFIAFEDKVICRSVPMSFNYKNNNQQFIESVVFHFNKKGLVENLTFGLSQTALDDIVKKDVWDEYDRLILVNFLENYKTAYALKRTNYIEKIFSDDALIITGKVVKAKPNEVNRYKNNRVVIYNRQTKQQYIKNLRYSFASKDYINIKFEQSEIRKAGKGGDIYGVQIKQNYYSDNYGDVGYLFLMVDLNNPKKPLIHVRTWQPEVGRNDSIYGLKDFN